MARSNALALCVGCDVAISFASKKDVKIGTAHAPHNAYAMGFAMTP